MSQPKLHSMIEQILNTGSGFILSLLAWTYIVIPLYHIQSNPVQNIQITLIFTVISIIRGYLWRRLFNWYQGARWNDFFNYYYQDGLLWFRIFGGGFLIKNSKKHPELFSQRNRLKKSIRIGNYYIEYLSKRVIYDNPNP